MNNTVAWIGSLGVGSALGIGVFVFLVPDVLLYTTLALFWMIGVRLTIRHEYDIPGLAKRVSGPSNWNAARWSGVFGGLIPFTAVGISLSLPISTELRFALILFVWGVELAMVNLGIAMIVDAEDEQNTSMTTENAV
jgi:hypothetical protein